MALPEWARAAGGEASDWPCWAPQRRRHYGSLARAAQTGTDIRKFGAVLDGVADDSIALERALASADVVLIPGGPIQGGQGRKMRLARPVTVSRPATILGLGARPTIVVAGRERDGLIVRPPGDEPGRFLGPVTIDNLHFERPAPLRAHGKAVKAFNVRGLYVTRCSASRMGLVGLHHTRQRLRQYRRALGTIEQDPAVLSGFSSRPDDLCEDLYVCDCDIDAGSHHSQLVRFDFTRRVLVAHNTGRFASISWWGGGGRREQGGDLAHLRRARDIYVCDNKVSGSIGGIYGNCGENILVARNHVSMVTDMGIDFEGCINALARDNVVENAGNACFATFFAARNVVFENNVAMQDGSAKDIHLAYGARKVGGVTGRTLLALRSGGFAAMDGSVEVAYRGNRFVWAGKDGLGHCLPSFFSKLELSRNRFENVRGNLAYRQTGALLFKENTLRFTQAAAEAIALISASAREIRIIDNAIKASQPPAAGSAAVLITVSVQSRSVKLNGNKITGAGGPLPLEIEGRRTAEAVIEVADNPGSILKMPDGE